MHINNMRYSILALVMATFAFIQTGYSQTTYPIETIDGTAYYVYKAEQSEGLFAISRRFNITQEEILQHNPALKEEGLKIDQTVLIPVNKKTTRNKEEFVEVTIEKGQTLYSLSKRYNTTIEAILSSNEQLTDDTFSVGKTIRIPLNTVNSTVSTSPKTSSIDLSQVFNQARKEGTIDVALILPLLQTKTDPENLSSFRFIEFYEGLLLALEELKKENVSVNLFVYDTGQPSEELGPIFNKQEMKEIDLIIGPVSKEHIKVVADHAERNGILLVLPFTSHAEEIKNNPFIFQINTPQEYLYEQIATYFSQTFAQSQVTFLQMEGNETRSKAALIAAIRKELTQQKIPFQEVTTNAENIFNLQDRLSTEKNNVIIPLSGSNKTLREMLPGLRNIAENDSLLTTQLSLFGYPEWQMQKEFFDTFYSLNTFIYTSFYDDVFSRESNNFYKRFSQWYSKDVVQTYPKYSMLGYDTGLFFFKALAQYGPENIGRIASFQSRSVQSNFKFGKLNAKSGYINKNIFFINYRPDFVIEKITFK